LSRVLACHAQRPDPEVIDKTAAALRAGQVVVMPTETQYALSIRADQRWALDRICAIKKRSEIAKTALFVKDLKMVELFCHINRSARRLSRCFLPGPLTLILPGKEGQRSVASEFLSDDGFGVRLSSSPVIAAVMVRVPFPVTATSANISGSKVGRTAEEIRDELGEAVDLYLEAGPCPSPTPSTVVRVADDVTVLRPGIISEEDIFACLEEGGDR